MKNKITRRDFLKITGICIGGLAMLPISKILKSVHLKLKTKEAKYYSKGKHLAG